MNLATKIVLILTSVVICAGTYAQNQDTLLAFEHLQSGHRLYKQDQNFDSAQYHYRKAAELYKVAGSRERQAFALMNTAFSYHRGKKYGQAELCYKQSIELYEEVYPDDHIALVRPNQALGALYGVSGNYYLGLIHSKRALEIKQKYLEADHIDIGVLYYNMGVAYTNYGEYDNSLDAYLKALPIYLKHHGESHLRLSSLYVNMGILYDKKGEPEKALEYYHKSLEIDLDLHGEDYHLLAYNYYNMAISYMNLKDTEQAEYYYRETIEKSMINDIDHLHAISHYGLGKIALENGDYKQAMTLFDQAIELTHRYFGSDFPDLNHSYRAMAEALTELKAYQRAEEYLNQALDLLKRNFGDHHPFIASTYLQIASLNNVQFRFDEALSAIDQGLLALTKRDMKESGLISGEFMDRYVLLELIREQALILQNKYYKGKGELTDLKKALVTLSKAIDYIDQVRRGFMLDDSKLLLQEEAMTTYEQAINTALALYQETHDVQHLSACFRYIEKSKATLLSETMYGSSIKHIQGVPDSVLQQEMEVKGKIRFVESQLNSDHPNPDSLNQLLFTLRRGYDALAKEIEHEFPDYYELKYQVNVAELDQFQQLLNPDENALCYFLGENHWFVMAISNDSAAISKIDTAAIRQMNLTDFREMASNPSAVWSDSLAYLCYHELIEKPLSGLSSTPGKLIIVPGGALGHIPMDALITTMPADAGRKPYLIYRYAVSYAPSITLLVKDDLKQTDRRYAGFAPVRYQQSEDGNTYPPLIGSLQEINHAKQLFGGELFLNENATEYNFKMLGSTRVLHLAMHGLVNDRNPMQSRLLFSTLQDSVEDGSLYAGEIYNMKLNSNLAILTACNTGFGQIARGEGIMNLSRAFQFAGSPNIIMSLWQASDFSTTAIMQSFFRNLKKGLPKNIALQKAKITFLEHADPFQAHPANWATFVLLGNSQPLVFKNYLWRWLTLGLLFILVMLWLITKYRQESPS